MRSHLSRCNRWAPYADRIEAYVERAEATNA